MSNYLPEPSLPEAGEQLAVQGANHRRSFDPGAWPEKGQLSWRRYVAAVFRYKWVVVGATAVGVAVGVAASRNVKPEYEASATIWIHNQGRDTVGDGSVRPSQLLKSSAWVDLLTSFEVLDHVVNELRLNVPAASAGDSALFSTFELRERFVPGDYRLTVDGTGRTFILSTVEGGIAHRGLVGDSIGTELGFSWAPGGATLPPGRTIEFSVRNPRDAALGLLSRLQARMDEEGSFMRVSLEGDSPHRTAAVLNAVTERFVEVAAELKREKLLEQTNILREHFAYANQNLREAEADLERFRVGSITLPSELGTAVSPALDATESPVLSNFFSLRVEVEKLRRDREALERVLAATGDSAIEAEALEGIAAVANASELLAALTELTNKRAELRALRMRYTEEHRPIRRLAEKIEELRTATIPGLARALLAELASREREKERLLRAASDDLRQIPPRAIEEARLRRRVEAAERLSEMVQQRYEEGRLAVVSTVPDVTILDAASPPLRPKNGALAFIIFLVASLSGVGVGLVGAVLLDRFDPRVRYPDQVSQKLGLPILGTVPFVRSSDGRHDFRQSSQLLEAFRMIRLGIVHTHGRAGPLVVAVTSVSGEEGKSFVSGNLALAFADLGLRTVAIDADVRRGRLHQLLGGSRKPGLIDYLAGHLRREQLVQSTVYRGLDRIVCGSRRRDGPELLQSPGMAALLASLRTAYDVIVVDSPPIGAGVDALALGTLTENVILVLRTGSTEWELTVAKLAMLERLPLRILGAVLNAVPLGRTYRHSYYSYESYLPGYESFDEEGMARERELIESVAMSAEEQPGPQMNPPSREAEQPNDVESVAELDQVDAQDAQSVSQGDEKAEPGTFETRWEAHRQHQRRTQLRHWR